MKKIRRLNIDFLLTKQEYHRFLYHFTDYLQRMLKGEYLYSNDGQFETLTNDYRKVMKIMTA